MKKTILIFLTLAFNNFLFACQETDNNYNNASKTPAKQIIPNIEMILVGTDILGIGEVDEKKLTHTDIGNFHIENGGIERSISISKNGNQFLIEKTQAEPGTKDKNKKYLVTLNNSIFSNKEGSIYIKGFSEGILVLEKENIELKNYWIAYYRGE